MKRLFAIAAILFAAASFAIADEAYDIMKKCEDADKAAKTSSSTATMVLTAKNGSTRTRSVTQKAKDYGNVKKSVIVFQTPKDVAGVSYLTWEYPEDSSGNKKDDDSWLYMPALKKSRRISGTGKGEDFMGTDFTYDDIGDRGLTKDTFTLLGSEAVDGVDCYKINCEAKDKTEKNPRRIMWICKSNYMVVRAEFFDRQDQLARELVCSGIAQIDGIWTTQKMLMTNVQKNTSTSLEMTNVSYNGPMEDSIFTVAALERGRK